MTTINEKLSVKKLQSFEAPNGTEVLYKKIIRIAQHESELELGVNPSKFDQANTGYLTEEDFEYIRRVCILVEKRLKDSDWLTKTIDNVETKFVASDKSKRGIKFDDELFKVGRGILETYLEENG